MKSIAYGFGYKNVTSIRTLIDIQKTLDKSRNQIGPNFIEIWRKSYIK